jgi:NAD-dependent histone deacetylase SIR2
MPRPPKRDKRQLNPRLSHTLDLTSQSTQSPQQQTKAKDALRNAILKGKKIVVIAGAGISVSAGIPDFRSSKGLFQSLRTEHNLKSSGKDLFDASVYKDDESTASFHNMIQKMSALSSQAKSTAFHRMLASLAVQGQLLRLYTQNIDGLDTRLQPLATNVPLPNKAPWPRSIQLHGSLNQMTCQKCQRIFPFRAALFKGPHPPECDECARIDRLRTASGEKRSHGIGRLRPRIVLYNEHHPDEEAIGAVTQFDLRQRPDTVIVVGTSLKINAVKRIVREMCAVVKDHRTGNAIWINQDPVPQTKELGTLFDVMVRGDADHVAKIIDMKDWEQLMEVSVPYTEDTIIDDEEVPLSDSPPYSSVVESELESESESIFPAAVPRPGRGRPTTLAPWN